MKVYTLQLKQKPTAGFPMELCEILEQLFSRIILGSFFWKEKRGGEGRAVTPAVSCFHFSQGNYLFIKQCTFSTNFEILAEDSDTGGPSSIAVRKESLSTIFVPIPVCELCLKNDEGEAESIRGGWGKLAYMEKKWRKIYDPFKIASLSR